VVTAGDYRVTIGYAAPEGNVAATMQLNLGGKLRRVTGFKAYSAPVDEGKRLFYTDEAPNMAWAERELGTFTLAPGLTQLTLAFAQDRKGHNLQLGYVKITQLARTKTAAVALTQ
jgi:hypothetical protein